MSITAIPTQTNAVNSIGLQDFLKILSTQLANQDPTKPMDDQQFVTQIAQFAALEQNQEVNQKIGQLLTVQSAVQAVGLLGKTVTFNNGGSVANGIGKQLDFSSSNTTMSILTSTNSLMNGIGISQILNVQ